jgi:biotin transport system substrate-specific component
MFPVSALLIGYASSRIKGNGVLAFIGLFIVNEIGGSLILYVTGVPWLAHAADLSFVKALAIGCYPYLLPDALKAIVASGILLSIRKYTYQRITPSNVHAA